MNRQHTVGIHIWEVWRANRPPKEPSGSLAAARAAQPPVLRRANGDLGEASPPQTPTLARQIEIESIDETSEQLEPKDADVLVS